MDHTPADALLKSRGFIDPLNPKSDKHLISPYSITPNSHIRVTRRKKNDHQLMKLLIRKRVFLVSSLENV